ncbi:MAG: leucine--tRNA ligase [bacterium]
MDKYNHKEIEPKWQERWMENKLYETSESQDKKKYYVLDMFPYPSGTGLHVGHPKGYIATDILARYKMLKGFNVLHPMGWDAFGLPAENYAIENKVHPKKAVEKNIVVYKKQMQMLGFAYDWTREINTTDPDYYKWTQWAFIQMFKKGLVYQSSEPINWCPSCKTGLANEDVEDGKCERCGTDIEKKPLLQWVIKITDYAERLLNDLNKLKWEEPIKEMQRNWISRSEGAEVVFKIKGGSDLKVFTTRPDTLFGCTYMVLCPEHELLNKLKIDDKVKQYIKEAKNKSDLERADLNKDKTGIKLEGIFAINPVNNEEIPIFVADYVLAGYGTGAIMAVPAHDERDFAFAKKYNLKIVEVVRAPNQDNDECYSGHGLAINSDFLNGMETDKAKKHIISWLMDKGIGKMAVNYKLKDWVFSRQRYWGEPIPLIHCDKCGVVPVLEQDLPLTLPDVESYEPSGTGESPLAKIEDWVNTICPKCKGPAKRETNTMPQWAGSCWYYLRYIDPENDKFLVDKEKEKYWSPVDFYVGGAEHATRHLIYARFWHKFLYDIGAVNYDEPFVKLRHVGLILAQDGRKMSKRWDNVINPDHIVEEFGADAMRVYEMFMGPFDQAIAWNTDGLKGARKFLDKAWQLQDKVKEGYRDSDKVLNLVHKTVKKVGQDIEEFKFNTAVSSMMILVNLLSEQDLISIDSYRLLLMILSPFAPHLSEEMWNKIGERKSIFKQAWPEYSQELIKDAEIMLVVQVNGKVRDNIMVASDISQDKAKELALASNKVKKWVNEKDVKIIFVPGKLINFVIK